MGPFSINVAQMVISLEALFAILQNSMQYMHTVHSVLAYQFCGFDNTSCHPNVFFIVADAYDSD